MRELVAGAPSPTLEAVQRELTRALTGLTGKPVALVGAPSQAGAVLFGTPRSSALIGELPLGLERAGAEGFVIRSVTWAAAKAGIVTGVLLAVARISGETAPLLFTALNNQFLSFKLNAPMASLPAVIFQYALSPYDDWHKLAWAGALLVTATVLTLSIIARVLETKRN